MAEFSVTPPLGTTERWGERQCSRAVPDERGVSSLDGRACGRPGTTHLAWASDPWAVSVACDQHAADARHRWIVDDEHPLTGDCGMPGAVWHFTDDPATGWCRFPADEPELVAAAQQPQRSGTPTETGGERDG